MRDERLHGSLLSDARDLARSNSFLTIAVALIGYIVVKPPTRTLATIWPSPQAVKNAVTTHSQAITRWSFRILIVCVLLHLVYVVTNTAIFGDDSFTHLSWLEDFARLRAAGIDYPRWLPDTFGGLGSPTFYFYPPLCYLIGDFLYSTGIATTGSSLFHGVSTLTLFLSGITSYRYLRHKQLLEHHAALGALLYMMASYRYVDVFTRSALAEHVAFAWIPLVFLALDHAIESRTMRSVLLSAISWSLLILTNIPATILTAVLAGCYAIAVLRVSAWRIWPAVAGGILAAMICGYYLLPIVHFHPFIQTEKLWHFDVFTTKWHHFLIELFDDQSRKSAIQLGALAMFLLALGVVLMLIRSAKPERSYRRGLLAIGLCCLVLQLPGVSDPLWELLPPLQLLQFSWRFSIGLVFFVAVSIAIGLHHKIPYVPVVLLLAACISLFFYIRFGYIVLTYPRAPDMVEPIRRGATEYVNRYLDLPRDSLRSYAIKMRDEPLITSELSIDITDVKQGINELSAVVSSTSPFDLRIKKFWWPQWKLEREGVGEVALQPDTNGLLLARALPAGIHRLHLTMTESSAERNGKRVSIAGISLFAVLCAMGWRYRRPAIQSL